MATSIYLINPGADVPGYHGADVCRHIGLPAVASIADIVMTTVAAMVPDDFELSICDEDLQPINFDTDAQYIGLTGKSSQVGRLLEVAQIFRDRGKVVLIGGPFASLSPDTVRPYCDILVIGELEEIAAQLFDDCRSGQWKSEYRGNQPDLRTSPVPRWDLYPNDRAITGCVQTSRGCPFACEFCDVIVYAGRKQRHKSTDQILAELDRLYQYGYSSVFLADDNFTVYRRRAKEILLALRDWNHKQADGALRFSTQLSIDTAREDDILQLCAEAGLQNVFVGIETPNEESLRETKKRQNLGIDMVQQIGRFVEHGIGVTGGMIVGFDSDKTDIFERQYQFAMGLPIPIFTVRALFAPEATPLHARMKAENRLIPNPDQKSYAVVGMWPTNLIPHQMTADQLGAGLRWLANRLYAPAAFRERLFHFIERRGALPGAPTRFRVNQRNVEGKVMAALLDLRRLGPEESRLFTDVAAATAGNSAVQWNVLSMLFQYRQIRHIYEQEHFWDPLLAVETVPRLEATSTMVSLTY